MQDYRYELEGKRRFDNPSIYKKTLEFQNEMAKLGVAWHNHFANECTIDFCCCQGDNMKEIISENGTVYPATNYKHYIPSFRTVIKDALDELYEEVKHGDLEHQRWLRNKFNDYVKKL